MPQCQEALLYPIRASALFILVSGSGMSRLSDNSLCTYLTYFSREVLIRLFQLFLAVISCGHNSLRCFKKHGHTHTSASTSKKGVTWAYDEMYQLRQVGRDAINSQTQCSWERWETTLECPFCPTWWSLCIAALHMVVAQLTRKLHFIPSFHWGACSIDVSKSLKSFSAYWHPTYFGSDTDAV